MSRDFLPFRCYSRYEDALYECLYPRGDADLMQIRFSSGFWFLLPSDWCDDDCYDYIHDYWYYIASHNYWSYLYLEGEVV